MIKSLTILILILSSSILAEDNRKALFEQANSGDVNSQEELAFVYGHWSSQRYDTEKAMFWRCQAALGGNNQAKINIEHLENWQNLCPDMIKNGFEKQFNIYFESGDFISNITIDDYTINLLVPSERIWKIEWNKSKCEKVCKSEIKVKGAILIDKDKNISLYGNFTIDSNTDKTSVIWILPGAEVYFNKRVEEMVISEYVQ